VLDDPTALTKRACDEPNVTHTSEEPFGAGFVHGIIALNPTRPDAVSKPMLIAVASKHVINDHSDFFRVEFIDWLSAFVLQVEARKLATILKEKERARSEQRFKD
jgi:hypothetical protein